MTHNLRYCCIHFLLRGKLSLAISFFRDSCSWATFCSPSVHVLVWCVLIRHPAIDLVNLVHVVVDFRNRSLWCPHRTLLLLMDRILRELMWSNTGSYPWVSYVNPKPVHSIFLAFWSPQSRHLESNFGPCGKIVGIFSRKNSVAVLGTATNQITLLHLVSLEIVLFGLVTFLSG